MGAKQLQKQVNSVKIVIDKFLKGSEKQPLIPYEGERVEYQIYIEQPDNGRGSHYPEAALHLIWSRREDARQFKRLLKSSSRQLKSKIIRREWRGGFIESEVEVW